MIYLVSLYGTCARFWESQNKVQGYGFGKSADQHPIPKPQQGIKEEEAQMAIGIRCAAAGTFTRKESSLAIGGEYAKTNGWMKYWPISAVEMPREKENPSPGCNRLLALMCAAPSTHRHICTYIYTHRGPNLLMSEECRRAPVPPWHDNDNIVITLSNKVRWSVGQSLSTSSYLMLRTTLQLLASQPLVAHPPKKL